MPSASWRATTCAFWRQPRLRRGRSCAPEQTKRGSACAPRHPPPAPTSRSRRRRRSRPVRKPMTGVEEFYAHALAIEREAMERYGEFEAWFGDRGEVVLAGLCANFAQMEASHLRELECRCRSMQLP